MTIAERLYPLWRAVCHRSGSLRDYALATLCGVLIGLTWLEPNWFPLAWIALFGLMFVIVDQPPGMSFRFGWFAAARVRRQRSTGCWG